MTDKTQQMSPREAAMERIANANREQLNSEIKKAGGTEQVELTVISGTTGDPDADPDDAAAEEARRALEAGASLDNRNTNPDNPDNEQLAIQREQEAAARANEDAAAAEAAAATQRAQHAAGIIDAKATYTIKVNGRDIEVTGEEVLRRAQKDTSADLRLEEANRVMQEARALQQSLEEQQRAQREADTAKTQGGNPDGVVVDPTVAKQFTAALFKGDEEAALKAFNDAVGSAVAAARKDNTGRGNATPVDPNAIAAQVRQQIAIDSALERSRSDYPELYADPDVEAVAAARIQRLVAEGKPFVAALDEVQTGFAQKFGWKKRAAVGTPPPQRTDRRDEKLERKAQLEQPIQTPNVKTASNEEPVQNVSAAILEIAKSRGQQSVS